MIPLTEKSFGKRYNSAGKSLQLKLMKQYSRPVPWTRLLLNGLFCMVMQILVAVSRDFDLSPRAGWPGAPNNR